MTLQDMLNEAKAEGYSDGKADGLSEGLELGKAEERWNGILRAYRMLCGMVGFQAAIELVDKEYSLTETEKNRLSTSD